MTAKYRYCKVQVTKNNNSKNKQWAMRCRPFPVSSKRTLYLPYRYCTSLEGKYDKYWGTRLPVPPFATDSKVVAETSTLHT